MDKDKMVFQHTEDLCEKYQIIDVDAEGISFTEKMRSLMDDVLNGKLPLRAAIIAERADEILRNTMAEFREEDISYRSMFLLLLTHLADQGYFAPDGEHITDQEMLDMASYMTSLMECYEEGAKSKGP